MNNLFHVPNLTGDHFRPNKSPVTFHTTSGHSIIELKFLKLIMELEFVELWGDISSDITWQVTDLYTRTSAPLWECWDCNTSHCTQLLFTTWGVSSSAGHTCTGVSHRAVGDMEKSTRQRGAGNSTSEVEDDIVFSGLGIARWVFRSIWFGGRWQK